MPVPARLLAVNDRAMARVQLVCVRPEGADLAGERGQGRVVLVLGLFELPGVPRVIGEPAGLLLFVFEFEEAVDRVERRPRQLGDDGVSVLGGDFDVYVVAPVLSTS